MPLHGKTENVITAATATTSTFVVFDGWHSARVFQADGTTSSGSGAATVKVQVSANRADWIDLGTITLTLGTTSTSDGFTSSAPWPYYRGNVTAISGTGASVNLKAGWISNA